MVAFSKCCLYLVLSFRGIASSRLDTPRSLQKTKDRKTSCVSRSSRSSIIRPYSFPYIFISYSNSVEVIDCLDPFYEKCFVQRCNRALHCCSNALVRKVDCRIFARMLIHHLPLVRCARGPWIGSHLQKLCI